MSKSIELEAYIAEKIQPLGFEVADVEYFKAGGQMILRIFIDKPGGVTLDDCSQASNKIAFYLDADNKMGNSRYTLEVSSPGLDRKLKKPADFKKFLKRNIVVKTFMPIENQRNFSGTLESADDEKIAVNDVTNGLKEIKYIDIAVARLKIE